MFRFAAILIASLFIAATAARAGEWPPPAPDLSVTMKSALPDCLETEDCSFLVRIENHGALPVAGPIRLNSRTAAPSVLGFGENTGWTCIKSDYGKFTCEAPSLTIAPGKFADLYLTLRFLPTPMSKAEACAKLDGAAMLLSSRNAILAALGSSAKPADSQAFLRAVYGTWGSGDLRGGNDQYCVTINLGPTAPAQPCTASQQQVDGKCVILANFCTANRTWNAAAQTCVCPAATPVFDRDSMSCASTVAASVSCSGERSSTDGFCLCPRQKPLWNGAASQCEILAEPQAKTEPPVIAKPKLVKVLPPKPRARSQLAAPRPPIAKPRRNAALKTTRIAQKARPYKSRCPPFFIDNRRRNYCWPGWILDPDLVINGPYPKP